MRSLVLCWLVLSSVAVAEEPPDGQPERLTLDDVIHIAKANHPTVATAARQADVMRARRQEAWAGFMPSLTASSGYLPQTANFAATPSFSKALATGGSGVGIGVTCRPGAMDPACMNPQPCVIFAGGPPCVTTSAPSSSGASLTIYNYWSLNFGINWTLWDFGKTYFGWQASKANVFAAEAAQGAALLVVTLNAKVAFYSALAAQQLVAVGRQTVQDQARHLEQILGFYSAGTRTRVDVAQQQSQYANAQLQLAKARGQLDSNVAVLAAALGVEKWPNLTLVAPPGQAPMLPENTPLPSQNGPITAAPALPPPTPPTPLGPEAPPPLPTAKEFDVAIGARPEIKQYQAQSRSIDETLRQARAGWFPSLSLSLGPSFAGSSLDNLTPNFQASVVLSYAGGLNPVLVDGQIREAKANRAVVDEQARAERNQIRLELAQAKAAMSQAMQEIATANDLLHAATDQRTLADARFQAGLGTVLDLEDAENNYVNARAQLIQAQLDLAIAQAQLDKANGHY